MTDANGDQKGPSSAEITELLCNVPTPVVSEPWTVEKVLKKLPGGPPSENSTTPLAFFHALERLKTTKREGWRRLGIESGESISDHMYRMSLITMFAPPALASRLDLARCTKMALVHDMAELLVGDITPVDGVSKPEKSRREAATMDYLTTTLLHNVPGGSEHGANLRAAWREYEDSETLESRFVHDVDKLELLLQMVEYERRGDGKVDLGEFAYVARNMTLPEMQALGQELLREREELWAGREHRRSDLEQAEAEKKETAE